MERGGIWSILERPSVYETLATVTGVRRWMRRFVTTTIRANEGDCILDIGCGPGALLRYLPAGVNYIGIDYSAANIAKAREHGRGRFICDDVANLSRHVLPPIDIAVAYGVLHHVDDDTALKMLQAAARVLKPGGRLITVDPCFHPAQTFIQRFVIERDRGMYVRQFDQNVALCRSVFSDLRAHLECGHLPPHSVCITQTG